ncbi:hypothetical protein GGS23DRAFT_168400 [Durotheca rogersii]|uniref:uncharacterized protein n=1 Tax=Durotheca rogersii TaxID=419775 RepID=UPI00221EB722|nr:uncharacterized protein GGS23DRAFT_168400 [Durotheca rogersii]KAI5867266.1 hypothetical protein GGS23DRAFT_168400 [Durotheca rogersii]
MTTADASLIMGGYSRHMACKPCRDRKVRCPGEQPICEKCRRSGDECIYLPTQKATKADLAQTVEDLQKRLGEAEARISKMGGLSNNNMSTPYSYGSDWSGNSEFSTLVSSSVATPSIVPLGGISPSTNQPGHPDLLYQSSLQAAGMLSNEFMEASQGVNQHKMDGRKGSAQFRVDERVTFDNANMDFYSKRGHPSQQDSSDHGQESIYTRNLSSGRTTIPSPTPSRDPAAMGKVSEETGAVILNTLAAFSSAMFRTQCEAAGMASVVADYIAWIRAVPTNSSPLNSSEVIRSMLENIEIRLRELGELAQQKHHGELRELLTALEGVAPPGGSMAARLSSLEEDLQRQSLELSQFFKTRYDPCTALAGQPRGTS